MKVSAKKNGICNIIMLTMRVNN